MSRSRRTYLAAILACALVLGTAMPAAAVTSAELRSHQTNAADARKKAAEAQKAASALLAETKLLDKQIDSLQADVDVLDPQISQASKRTAQLKLEMTQLQLRIAEKRSEIESTTAEYETQRALLADRVNSSYRQGDWFFFDMLLNAKDIGDFITRTELVSRVIRANNDVAAQLSMTRDSLDHARAELERSLESVSAKKHEAQAVETQLHSLQNSRQSKVNQSASVRKQKSDLMVENQANAKRLLAYAQAEEAEAERVASILRARGHGSGVYNGVMQFPVASGYVSSGYGWRIHPIFKTKKFHRGVDIAASSGTSAYAAGNGTVIKADYGWGGGYGNRVWIDHGNGVITTYNHLLAGSFKVSTGTKVTKGQTIALVGSSGYSTGPHLHFEVWVNGETRDPMTYLQ